MLLFDDLILLSGLAAQQFWITALAVLAAGLVRGFTGFGLSAVMMAAIASLIPPVELIPLCIVLETTAGIAMFRGGLAHADMTVVWRLTIGSAIGVPVGLLATMAIDPELSKIVALLIVLSLTVGQLLRLRPRFLTTQAGLLPCGFAAGIITGLASVGGMLVALLVLARDTDAKTMRASLVMFLFIGMLITLVYLMFYDLLDRQVLLRSAIFAPVVVLGTLLGSALFRPAFTHLYKTSCLMLLIILCVVGLARQFVFS
jgi:uncharacterized membrane protein YfcA